MDDLVRNRLPADLRQAARVMAETGAFETGQGIMEDAADEIERLRSLVQYHEEMNRQAEASRAAAFRMAFPSGWRA